MKISKLLPIALAFTLCTSTAVFAVEDAGSKNATANFQLNLPEFIKITATNPGEADATYETDYTGINLSKALSGTFTVISNKPEKTIYLYGKSKVNGGEEISLYPDSNTDVSSLNLVFTNESHLPKPVAVSNIVGKTSSGVADNADAIAFKLTPSGLDNDIQSDDAAGTWDATKKQIAYAIKNGTTTFTYTLAQTANANTFSTHDTMGTYKATLTMTDTSL